MRYNSREVILRMLFDSLKFFFCSSAVSAFLFSQAWVPPEFLVGEWHGKETTTVRTKIDGEYFFLRSDVAVEIHLVIGSDGKITGNVGNALFQDCYVYKNRGRVGRLLNLETDFVVRGKLVGKIFPEDPHPVKEISIPFNCVDGKTNGTLFHLMGIFNLNLFPMSDFRVKKID